MTDTELSIGIVTFRQRAESVTKLVHNIRQTTTSDIVLVVNGNNDEAMPDIYRQDMLGLAKQYDNVYPIVCPEFKSLCKLWNTVVIFSRTEHILLIGDDVAFNNGQIVPIIQHYIADTGNGFFTINWGFSHFVVSKSILHQLGYFDERLLGFGEEDGDIMHRYIEQHGERMPNIMIPGIYNKALSGLSMENMETHIDNKPRFNREFANMKYRQDPNGIYGMSPVPIMRVLDDYQQYPYENFVKRNRHNIAKFTKILPDL